MRKTENDLVTAIGRGDIDDALDLLQELLLHDRRRAWWALFRVAAGQIPDDRRDAMIALVGKTYIARRIGRMIGVREEQIMRALVGSLLADDWESHEAVWNEEDLSLLKSWLPERLRRTLPGLPKSHEVHDARSW